MRPEFSSALLLRVLRTVPIGSPRTDGSIGPPQERCGILRGREARVMRADFAGNVAPDPYRRFEIDPAALIRAYRQERRGGLAVLGFFHTHPEGSAHPSRTDADCAAPDGKLWLIASREGALVWRAVADGQVHGRFDPVPFDLRTGSRVEKGLHGVQWRGTGVQHIVPIPLQAAGEIE